MRVAVFDLDGTLADTAEDLIVAANGALAEIGAGMPLVPGQDDAIAFRGGRAMLREGFARTGAAWREADVERLFPRLLAHYRDGIDGHTRLYDGAETALTRLAAQGWVLAVCTNKPEALAALLIERLGLDGRFAALLGPDTIGVRKPDPRHLLETIARAGGRPARAVLVGDTDSDRAAAGAAGVPCVLVTFGPEGRAVERLAPEALLGHFDELPALLERLVPVRALSR